MHCFLRFWGEGDSHELRVDHSRSWHEIGGHAFTRYGRPAHHGIIMFSLTNSGEFPRKFKEVQYGGYSRKSRCAIKVIVWSHPLQSLTECWCLHRCNTESEWYQIHENIIKKLNARYNLTGSNAGECVGLANSPSTFHFRPFFKCICVRRGWTALCFSLRSLRNLKMCSERSGTTPCAMIGL